MNDLPMNDLEVQLANLQALPHKWWKKGKLYVPLKEDISVDFYEVMFMGHKLSDPNSRVAGIEALLELEYINDIVPTKADFMLAINTEMIEYLLATTLLDQAKEKADIAIFCALFLKTYYNYKISDIYNFKIRNYTVELHPVYSWGPNLKHRIEELLAWSITSEEIANKARYNKRRSDHGNPRY